MREHEDDAVADDRVEAMLQQYYTFKDEVTTGRDHVGSLPVPNASNEKTACVTISKSTESMQGSHSQPSTVPTLPSMSYTTSGNLTPAKSKPANAYNEGASRTPSQEKQFCSSNELSGDRSREVIWEKPSAQEDDIGQAKGDEDANFQHEDSKEDICVKQGEHGTPTPNQVVTGGEDELAPSSSNTPAKKSHLESSQPDKGSQESSVEQADEIGSDDYSAGLLKEQYQPRPSRSRSNRNDSDLVVPVDFSKRPEAAAKKNKSERCKSTALAKPSPKREIDAEDEDSDDPIKQPTTRQGKQHNGNVTSESVLEAIAVEGQEPAETDQVQLGIAIKIPLKSDPPVEEKKGQISMGSSEKKKRGRPRKRTFESETEASGVQGSENEDEDLPDSEHSAKAPAARKRRKKRKEKTLSPTVEDSDSDKDANANHSSERDLHTNVAQTKENVQPKDTKGKKATLGRKPGRKRKADTAPPILEDSTSDKDEDTNPPPHSEHDPPLSQSKGNAPPPKSAELPL